MSEGRKVGVAAPNAHVRELDGESENRKERENGTHKSHAKACGHVKVEAPGREKETHTHPPHHHQHHRLIHPSQHVRRTPPHTCPSSPPNAAVFPPV